MKALHLHTRFVSLAIAIVALMLVGWPHPASPVAAQSTPAPTPTIITPATEIPIAPGESSALPAVMAGPNMFTLIGTADPPAISALDAQMIVAAGGTTLAFGGTAPNGQPVTVSAIHGLATSGWAANITLSVPGGGMVTGACVNWLGPCNYPIYRCIAGGMCMETGEIIPRFENRPMWLIDVGGATFVGSRTSVNHSVYLVDDEFKAVTFIWGYNGP